MSLHTQCNERLIKASVPNVTENKMTEAKRDISESNFTTTQTLHPKILISSLKELIPMC